jgi:hypothetical protein
MTAKRGLSFLPPSRGSPQRPVQLADTHTEERPKNETHSRDCRYMRASRRDYCPGRLRKQFPERMRHQDLN